MNQLAPVAAFREFNARILSLFRKQSLDRELDAELRSHLELATEDFIRRGLNPAEARRQAHIRLGGVEASRELHRDSRGLAWLEGFFRDIRYAARGLKRDRAFTITAIAMLALTLGLNVTVFTVMNTMLFRGFPLVRNNDRLVYMQERNPLHGCCLAWPDFEDWRRQAKSFTGMAFISGAPIKFSEDDTSRGFNTFATQVSANAFSLLGVEPALGRDFERTDEASGAAPVVVLSDRFWTLRLGKRTDIVGRTVWIDKARATVIGVMPPGFHFPEESSLWMPLVHTPRLLERAPGGYMAFGRLAEGATPRGARAELEAIGRRLAAAWPATNRNVVPRVDTWSEFFIGPDAALIYGSMWIATWFVLIIACANLANLTLARTIGRSREFSTRLALGAGHGRMFRQILTESLLLAGAGGALGWWLARWSVRVFAAATASPHQILDYTIGHHTLGYLAAVSLVAAILFGVAPAVRVVRLDSANALKGDVRGITQNARGKHLSAILVAAQMALAIVLLAGAGVLVSSFFHLMHADLGVKDPEHVLTGLVVLPADLYPGPESRVVFFKRLKDRLEAIPGAEAETIASSRPLDTTMVQPFQLDEGAAELPQPVTTITIAPDYFRVVGSSILSGRDFEESDRAGGLPAAIVNQRFAEKFWPGKDPKGRRVRLYEGTRPGPWRTVAGVAANIMQADPTRQQFQPVVYIPIAQQPAAAFWFFLRTRVPPAQLTAAVRAAIQHLEPDLSIENLSVLTERFRFQADMMDLAHTDIGRNAALSPIFAAIALLLATIGLYAVIAQSVSRRTQEIGVRMALGATPRQIRTLVFRQGMWPVVMGLAAGLVASVAVTRLLRSQLLGVSPSDPFTLAAAAGLLLLTALAGCWLPASRAIQVDPATALRQD